MWFSMSARAPGSYTAPNSGSDSVACHFGKRAVAAGVIAHGRGAGVCRRLEAYGSAAGRCRVGSRPMQLGRSIYERRAPGLAGSEEGSSQMRWRAAGTVHSGADSQCESCSGMNSTVCGSKGHFGRLSTELGTIDLQDWLVAVSRRTVRGSREAERQRGRATCAGRGGASERGGLVAWWPGRISEKTESAVSGNGMGMAMGMGVGVCKNGRGTTKGSSATGAHGEGTTRVEA